MRNFYKIIVTIRLKFWLNVKKGKDMLKQFTSFVAVASVSAFLAVSLSGCEEKKEEKAQEAAPQKAASAPAPTQSTLEKVKSRGHLQCGINTGLAGFAYTNDKLSLIHI